MQRSICLLLAVVLSTSILSPMAYGFVNPLQNYNLYDDVHSKPNDERDNVMSEMFYNQNGSNNEEKHNTPPKQNPTSAKDNGLNEAISNIEVEIPQRRNDYLRESSKQVYAPAGTPRWEEGDVFYENPTLDSIKEKYRQSNFAGCMQEAEAYVRKNPNDTLGFYYLAMCYSKADDADNAVRAYEKVISLNANPMIVKYATNGRNCVLKTSAMRASVEAAEAEEKEGDNDEVKSSKEDDMANLKCFENVNEPDYLYPYKEMANTIEMTPVDPQKLIEQNYEALRNKYAPSAEGENNSNVKLPFGAQDDALDKFIQAPYGSGMSPELEKQYKQMKLKELQQNVNIDSNTDNKQYDYYKNINNFKNFDKNKTDSGSVKLAMADENDLKDFFNSPEYIQNKKELDQIRMMFGENSSKENDLLELIPMLTQGDEKLSPQAMQALMMQSVMPDIINIDRNNSF